MSSNRQTSTSTTRNLFKTETSLSTQVPSLQRFIPSTRHGISSTPDLTLQNLQPVNIDNPSTLATSGLKYFPPSTLQDWEAILKSGSSSAGQESAIFDVESTDAFELDDFNVYNESSILEPILSDGNVTPTLIDRRLQVGPSPTGTSLTTLVAEHIPLNTKQRLVVQRILSQALSWKDHPYDPLKRQQTLLYVGGEGGVGKSQIIKAIVEGMNLINRKHEVILMAPTGAAAITSEETRTIPPLGFPSTDRAEPRWQHGSNAYGLEKQLCLWMKQVWWT